jgi:hypothetical protein
MSANDANPAGEVGKANNKDGYLIESPNITHASSDESEPYVDAKEEDRKAARKKAETVDIDGVPIPESEQKYKSDKIKARDAGELFVNVDRREIEKKERRQAKAEESARKKEANRSRAQKIKRQVKDFFFKGWHKIVFISVIVAIILGGAGYTIWYKVTENERREAERIAEQERKANEEFQRKYDFDAMLSEARSIMDESIGDGIAKYDEIIANLEDDKQKSIAYQSRSEEVFSKNNSAFAEQIISDAQMAYDLNNSNESLGWLVFVYGHHGNVAEYEKYKAILDKTEIVKEDDTIMGEG